MMTDIFNSFGLGVAFLVLFAVAELLYHRYHVKVEWTRKIVHLGTGILATTFPFFLNSTGFVALLCGSFLVILIVSKRYTLLKSINAIDRQSSGSYLFPCSVLVCFSLARYFGDLCYYYLPILVLAISDPAAALIGKRWPIGRFEVFGQAKTVLGSVSFLLTALLVSGVTLGLMADHDFSALLAMSLGISVSSAVVEAVSPFGIDNLTIPLVVVGILYLFAQMPIVC